MILLEPTQCIFPIKWGLLAGWGYPCRNSQPLRGQELHVARTHSMDVTPVTWQDHQHGRGERAFLRQVVSGQTWGIVTFLQQTLWADT